MVNQFTSIGPTENFWVVTYAAYEDIIKEQLVDIPTHHVLLAEPEAKNTAPYIACACWTVRKEWSTANAAVTPPNPIWAEKIFSIGI